MVQSVSIKIFSSRSLGVNVQFFDSLNWEFKTIEKLELLMFLKYALCL